MIACNDHAKYTDKKKTRRDKQYKILVLIHADRPAKLGYVHTR